MPKIFEFMKNVDSLSEVRRVCLCCVDGTFEMQAFLRDFSISLSLVHELQERAEDSQFVLTSIVPWPDGLLVEFKFLEDL